MSELALDEMSVLSAIYCEKDEFELLEESAEKGLVFRIQMEVEEATSERTLLSLLFQLPTEYPHCVPEICVSSEQLSRKQCQHIKQSLLEKASALEPEPMVHELLLWLQQNFTELTSNEQSQVKEVQEGGEEETWIALFLIDHMRSKTKYIKTIEKWSSELGLTGRLFLGKLILVLLQGARRSIKEYIHLQRTVKVDVDSSGKRCKEKMMRVLCETQVSDPKRISSFEVKEFLSLEELKREFEQVGLLELYQEFVPTLL
ncbi:RWD domain-containing protein 3 isoform X2 [Coregonus clupeaformis]|uniref:RWD domain-containing protein 3 isoform X2 n=2 Tax=Coregonus clupeaformis TaxID=59861 RepID=UPI001BE09495|nr:RWD domain-containing protein 3 isoform X2 [Coregonus clupeaformis]